jgi:hypothetical protein
MDVIEEGKTGFMDKDLSTAVYRCLSLDRNKVQEYSMVWSWEHCWNIFKDNLVPV